MTSHSPVPWIEVRKVSMRWCCAWTLLAALFFAVPATASSEVAKPKNHVEIGLFVTSIFDLDFESEKFTAIFWAWFIADDPEFDPQGSIAVVNARSYDVLEEQKTERHDGRVYVALKMKAVINKAWNLAHFPFDRQRLKIILGSVDQQSSELRLTADGANSTTDTELHLHDWEIFPMQVSTRDVTYNTTFGEEEALFSTYPRVEFHVDIERHNRKLFFEVFIGYFIAVVACLAIWMTSAYQMLEYRIGLILAAIFAAIGNKDVFETKFPSAHNLGLEDHIEFATFLLISGTMFLSVLCEGRHLSGRSEAAKAICNRTFPILFAGYVIYVGAALRDAIIG